MCSLGWLPPILVLSLGLPRVPHLVTLPCSASQRRKLRQLRVTLTSPSISKVATGLRFQPQNGIRAIGMGKAFSNHCQCACVLVRVKVKYIIRQRLSIFFSGMQTCRHGMVSIWLSTQRKANSRFTTKKNIPASPFTPAMAFQDLKCLYAFLPSFLVSQRP